MAELVGQHLGQYEIVKELARGGMATVYLARQSSMGRDVAIKVLPANFTHDESFLERFTQEVEVIAQLQHPHILPVYDYGEFEDQPYIVMAYLSGGTLADWLGDGTMSLRDVGRVVGQIAEALDFAHSKGIIHRDLKPGNVLLDERKNAYLADFGLAKLTQSSKDITGTNVIGTPTYMAPEQAQSAELSPGVDIYALGVTVYQMLAGVVPYDAPTLAGVLVAHITEPIPDIRESRPDLSDDVQRVIATSLAKKREERYPSSGQFASELLAALEGRVAEKQASASETREMTQPALMMTNMLGHVIFVDNQCLNLLKRHHNEARNIIGKSIQSVLGIDNETAKQILDTINTSNRIDGVEIEVIDARGNGQPALLSALATRDDEGTFVGADITLTPRSKPEDRPPSEEFHTANQIMDTQEKTYLQEYFIMQIESLYELMGNWAGAKVARYLEDIINETGRRNVWPVSMDRGKITVELRRTDLDVYKALLTRAMVYSASIIGKDQVIKEIEYVNKNTNPSVLSFARVLGMDTLYKDVLQ